MVMFDGNAHRNNSCQKLWEVMSSPKDSDKNSPGCHSCAVDCVQEAVSAADNRMHGLR